MTHLLWGILNIGIIVLFIVFCFNSTKYIREKYGLFAAVIFVSMLLSFVVLPNKSKDNKSPNSNQIKTWKFSSEDSLKGHDSYMLHIDLEKTIVSKCDLGIKYVKNQQQSNIPIIAYSSTSGFIIGNNWKPLSILINRTKNNNHFEYYVDGIEEWKLLGITLYAQLKEYKGVALVK